LKEDQISLKLLDYFGDKENYYTDALCDLTQNLHAVYGAKPYIIIDEYDKPLMDNIHSPELTELKSWITAIFGAAMKDNPSLEKAVLTGVTRIAKENMFSGLNNLAVYDVLKQSAYDTDFSLTESELAELVPADKIEGVRKWYNNMRVGDALLYNIYSVMNYLSDGMAKLQGYWSMSGNASLLASLLAAPSRDGAITRVEAIQKMLGDGRYRHNVDLDYQLNMEHIKDTALCNDVSFYTLAVQSGYLSFEPIDGDIYNVFIPNMEARQVWSQLILDTRYHRLDSNLYSIFAGIEDTDEFSKQLTDFTTMALSYNDFKAQDEWVYHVFFLGLVYSLGYECKSNLEAGLGRFDIMVKSPSFCAVIEFKVSDSETDEAMQKEADRAIEQIDAKEYMNEYERS